MEARLGTHRTSLVYTISSVLSVPDFYSRAFNARNRPAVPGADRLCNGVRAVFLLGQAGLMDTRSRVIEPDEYPELHRMVERLCAEADLPKPRIAIMQTPVPNAFATGRNPKHAVVAVTDSIMRLLTPKELEAVLAHELSHVKNRDILTLTVASFIAMIAAIIMQNFLFASLFSRRDGENPWIIAGIVAIIVYFVAQLLIMALSRYREFAADRGSALITERPRDLISALQKISEGWIMSRSRPNSRWNLQMHSSSSRRCPGHINGAFLHSSAAREAYRKSRESRDGNERLLKNQSIITFFGAVRRHRLLRCPEHSPAGESGTFFRDGTKRIIGIISIVKRHNRIDGLVA